jgi:glucosamine--fructose-6-phosphate aminotransferase (isomerizing)
MNAHELAERVFATGTWSEAAGSGDAVAGALDSARGSLVTVAPILGRGDPVVYAGAGSSYYVAQVAAWAHRAVLGAPAEAAPLSELLLRPEGVLVPGDPARRPVVVISRSGTTSEAVALAERSTGAGHPVIAVTCRPSAQLGAGAPVSLVSPLGDERSIVMTRSFTSMLALLLRVVAGLAGGPGRRLAADLDTLPDRWSEASAAARLAPFAAAAEDWSRVVILGGGAAAGIAAEAGLKITETGRVPVDAYAPLEFRHGPISVTERGVLILALLGGTGTAEELAVVRESVEHDACGWILGPGEDALAELPAPADGPRLGFALGAPGGLVATRVGDGLHPLARLPLLMPPIQALALGLALRLGHDPDVPRHLGQVVILGA